MNLVLDQEQVTVFSHIIYTADNEKGLVMLPAAIEQLRTSMAMGKAFCYLRDAVIPNDGHLYGKDSFSNYYTNFPEDIAGKIIAIRSEKENGRTLSVMIDVELTGDKGEMVKQLQEKGLTMSIVPRTIEGAHNDDARRRYIHFIAGLYFVPHN